MIQFIFTVLFVDCHLDNVIFPIHLLSFCYNSMSRFLESVITDSCHVYSSIADLVFSREGLIADDVEL